MTGMTVKQLKDKDGNAIQGNSPDKVGYFASTATADLTWGVDNEITEDGWIRIQGNSDESMAGRITGYINGNAVFSNVISSGVQISNRAMYPVKKGDTVKAEGGVSNQWLGFFANRTNLENGGGEFDTLNISSTLELGVV